MKVTVVVDWDNSDILTVVKASKTITKNKYVQDMMTKQEMLKTEAEELVNDSLSFIEMIVEE